MPDELDPEGEDASMGSKSRSRDRRGGKTRHVRRRNRDTMSTDGTRHREGEGGAFVGTDSRRGFREDERANGFGEPTAREGEGY
ncbi:hypothetical protein BHE74_00008660 [Ensete ventricosum]|nr:hypothetical protein BHE74_00008660 [Ensete ventricosum]RZR87337.1 hypothetical protein BHM03_00014715 [Ensete ventricosum]